MTLRERCVCACATLILATSTIHANHAGAPQGAATAAARAAADSPALVGALFGVAKSRLKAEEFSLVAAAVPGMTSLLGAAPPADAGGAAGLLKSAGGLAAAASAFNKLGLKPELVAKAVPVLTSFVTKSGGPSVGNLLAGVLK